ncbi:MAG: sensor histidine kinase [Cyclobacteriaceae bacterium]
MAQSTSYGLSLVMRVVKKNIFDWLIIPFIGGLVIALFLSFDSLLQGNYDLLISTTILSAIFWTVLSNGNKFLAELIDLKWAWLQEPEKRFAIGMVVLMIYTVLASCAILVVHIEIVLGLNFYDELQEQGWLNMLSLPVLITLFVALIIHGRNFLISWRQAAIDLERFKNKNLISQYESLKNQVNPHFLFNTLNALMSLVHSDQKKAVDFIRKFADVFRYVLDHQFDQVVQLSTELKFVKSFIYLNKTRFGNNLHVHIVGMENVSYDYVIPPLTLQMLLENALKHNVVSNEENLTINIVIGNNQIVFSNNLNPKPSEEDSSGVGLNNIHSRYNFLTEKKIQVLKSDEKFEVRLPQLKSKGVFKNNYEKEELMAQDMENIYVGTEGVEFEKVWDGSK